MSKNHDSIRRWLTGGLYLGVIALMLACSVLTGAQLNDEGTLQLEDGVIEVQNEAGDWVPVAGSATFELVGELESLDPWTVAGTTFETNELTQIEEGLQIGDLVRVQGTILEDGTWVAYSIEREEEQTDPIIVMIGVVDSVDPWVVNGIELNVTGETDIQGEISPGMIVRVEILLLPDGNWEVLSIAPLGESTETSGCATVIATVVSVSGDEIQFLGWPTTVILQLDTQNEGNNNDSGSEGNLADDAGADDNLNANENANGGDENGGVISAGQTVMAVVCISEDGTFVIVQVTILNIDGDDGNGDTSTGGEKVLVCHKPDKKGGHTLSISSSAVPAHLGHGDTLGPCP